MSVVVSAFRNPSHPDGYMFADNVPFFDIEEAISWIYTNIFRARNKHAVIRFEAIADQNGIAEMTADYEGEWSMQNFDLLNDIQTVIIRRSDYASDRAAE